MKKVLITEDDKKHILNLYGILKNQLNEATTTNLTPIELTVNFKSGCHSNTGGEDCPSGQVDAIFSPYIEQIKTFVKSAPKNEIVEVVLSASESKVPNRDAEQPKGTDGKHPKLAEKELSKKRYATLKTYLTDVFKKMMSEKSITKLPVFVEKDPIVGTTKWDGVDPNAEKYKKEQYLKAVIQLRTYVDPAPDVAKKECIQGVKIEYSYDEVVEAYEGHCCSRGRFNLYANGVKLSRTDGKSFASINNNLGTEGTQDKQNDTRTQLDTKGLRKTADGTNDICYTTNNEKNTITVKGQVRDKYNFTIDSKPGNYRYNTFLISSTQADSIITSTKGQPGLLTITAKQTEDNTNPHKEAVRVTIYNPSGTLIYDSCEGGACTGGAFGPWKVNFCATSSAVATTTK